MKSYFREGRCQQTLHFLFYLFSSDFLSSLCSNLLSDCIDGLFHQLEKHRLLSNELRVALNDD